MAKFEITRGKKWFTGRVEIQFNYNLKWLLLPFIVVWLLIQAVFRGLAWLVEKVIGGLWWLLKKFWIVIVAIWMWLKGLFNYKPTQQQQSKEKKETNLSWWWLIVPLLLLLGFLTFRSCSADEQKERDYVIIEEVYEDSWDDVVKHVSV